MDIAARLDARPSSGTCAREPRRISGPSMPNWRTGRPLPAALPRGNTIRAGGPSTCICSPTSAATSSTPAARAKIFEVLEEYTKPGEYAYETEPRRMVNTNHPLNGAMALVLAGQLMGKPERIALGRDRVRYFLDWLRDVTPADLPEQFAERRKAAQQGITELSRGPATRTNTTAPRTRR